MHLGKMLTRPQEIDVLMDRCMMVDHRHMAVTAATQAPEEMHSHGIRTR